MFKKHLIFAFVFLSLAFFSSTSVLASTGAIFTTDVECAGTNVNIFANKNEVHLDGGPHHEGSAGLPDGNYFVKVTEPDGTLLGVSAGADITVTNGNFNECYNLFALTNFSDTSNGGGVYKVWVSTDANFANSTNKTDNFKVKADPIENGSISGLKWEDDDANGEKDPGEHKLDGWTIELWNADHTGSSIATTVTAQSGFYDFDNVVPGTYQVCEVIKNGWHATYPNVSDTTNCNTEVVVESKKTTKDVNFGNWQNASLTVIKHVINDNGGTKEAGDFTMMVDGNEPSDDSFAGSESGTAVTIKPGAYSVTESGPNGYTESDSAECSGTATSGAQITCTITNDDQPGTLIVKKIVNNTHGGNLGPEDFSFKVNASDSQNFEIDGQNDLTVNAGTYSIVEDTAANYEASYEGCENVEVGNGETKTCTITNNDIAPMLTLVKTVTNDNGGTKIVSDFPLFVDDTPVVSGVATSFEVGAYTASESSSFGYAASVWGGDCAEDGSVNLNFGDNKTCTITNDDIAPSLTLLKNVVNDNGGAALNTAWTLTATGSAEIPTNLSGTTPATSGADFKADTYVLGEKDGPTGYNASAWSCVKNDLEAVSGSSITLGVGDVATCEITNDDQAPHLIVKKIVNNQVLGSFVTNVPSDFTMNINGVTAQGGNSFPGNSGGVDKTLTSIGNFNVTESGPGGYNATFEGCTGTIALGETKTCTITNTAQPGRMTGGGSVLSANTKITHGFTLHCNIAALPNNLEINWNDKAGKAHKFHLDSLTSVNCTKDGNPSPPKNTANGFNTLTATGIGKMDDKSVGIINFTFTDNGEPGKNDTANYNIIGGVGLVANGKLTQGNHQAHSF